MRNLRRVLFIAILAAATGDAFADIACPPMPAAVTNVSRDIRSDISASVGTLGPVKAGEIGSKTEVIAKTLFDKYPNIDKLLTLQTMAATYCSMLASASIPDTEKLARWESFQERVLGLRTRPPTPDGSKTRGGTVPTIAEANPVFPKGTILRSARGSALSVDAQLHAGTDATLYLAKTKSGDTVVVKIFWRGLGPNSPAWEHFKNEQQVAAGLKHRNIISILDTGLVEGYPFTVMQYFRGQSLKEWLDTHDRIPGEDILSIATQVADAIDFAHLNGITHRDIKPSNILIESDPKGRVVLSDFGVARVFGAAQIKITASRNELVGSAAYLAPEAIKGRDITPASDIYAFGTVLYEMIAGKDPFPNSQIVAALLFEKANKDAPDIREVRKDVPEAVAKRLAQTLSREPNDRPQSARAVLAGIETELRGL
jgi:serine/threonine protein kinase